MSDDEKTTRRALLRPLHLLGIALACGVFAALVTAVSTGAFTDRVRTAVANGTYSGLSPIALGLVVGGGAFIVVLLIMSMLILAVDPKQYEAAELDRPVLYDEESDAGAPAAPTSTDAGGHGADASGAAGSEESGSTAEDGAAGA